MLYNISSATSVNKYTATLTQPGVYYFSCPVCPFLHRLCSNQSHCSNACGNVCILCCACQIFTAICCCCSTACVIWKQAAVFLPERCVKRMGLLQVLTAGLAWFTAGDWSLPIWTVADRNCVWPCGRHCVWYHLCNVKTQNTACNYEGPCSWQNRQTVEPTCNTQCCQLQLSSRAAEAARFVIFYFSPQQLCHWFLKATHLPSS